jgi:hypothetical protein
VLTEFPAYAWTRGGGIGLAVLLAIIGLTAALVLRSGQGLGSRGPRLGWFLPPLPPPGHSGRKQQRSTPALGISADVAVPGGSSDNVRKKVPRGFDSSVGNRRPDNAVGLGL